MNEILLIIGLILISINGAIFLMFAIIEFSEWLSRTKWFKKHFTQYGG